MANSDAKNIWFLIHMFVSVMTRGLEDYNEAILQLITAVLQIKFGKMFSFQRLHGTGIEGTGTYFLINR